MFQAPIKNTCIVIVMCLLFVCNTPLHANLSSLTKNDGYPIFTTLDPHTFLYTKEKLKYKYPEFAKQKHDFVSISISPFGQNADRGKDITGKDCVELSDLTGRWNILALLFGALPAGEELPPTLQEAFDDLFPGVPVGTLNDCTKIDPNEEFGFMCFPLKYRKRGVRFELQANLIAGLGLNFQTGLASIRQTVTGIVDHTCKFTKECPFDPSPLTEEQVKKSLTNNVKKIADEIGLDIGDFCETSVEEIRLNLFWRHAYELNRDKPEWPHVLVIPFFEIGGSLSPGRKKKPCEAFGVPFGNNDHSALGFTVGFDFDFIDTIEFGAEVGMTHFFDQDFENFFVPTSPSQSSIYPFSTSVTVSPGHSWHFAAKIAAFHFLEHLSVWFQYVIVEHKEDSIKLKKCDGAFLPEELEKISTWKLKVANIGFNYDISPNVGLGFLWQAPLSQRNTYRSTTIMGSVYFTF